MSEYEPMDAEKFEKEQQEQLKPNVAALIAENHLEVCRTLLESGHDPHTMQMSLLLAHDIIATEHGHPVVNGPANEGYIEAAKHLLETNE